jgi:4-hydroxybutyryl-CoA dehydratase/vinylacetyl-CoA-Delta-isomerase
MKTGDDYRASIRDGRRIFFDGDQVEDVTTHPLMRHGVDRIARGYDRYYQPGEDAVPPSFDFPRSAEDLRAQLALFTEWDTSLITTVESLLAMLTAGMRMKEKYPEYAERFEHFVEYFKKEDLRCVQTISDAKGDRALSPAKQDDPDVYVRVVEKRSDGIVINGAKLHISAAALTHEMLVMPTKRMKSGEEPWAVACAVPVNSPGVTILGNTTPEPRSGDPLYHPHSYGHGMPEGFVVFDHVFVPNERVFLCGEIEHSATLAHSLGLWQRIGGIANMAKNYDTFVGLAQLMAEANGIDRIAHIRDKISEMVLAAALVRSGFEAAINNCTITPEGWATPNELFTNAAKHYGAVHFGEMYRHLHDISGGSIVTAPLPGDLKNPETAPLVEKYMRTKEGISGAYRTRLFHAIRDMTADSFGGWWLATTNLSGGGLFAQKMVATKHYDMENAKALARKAAKLDEDDDARDREATDSTPAAAVEAS